VFLTIYICTSNLLLLFDNTTGMTHLQIIEEMWTKILCSLTFFRKSCLS